MSLGFASFIGVLIADRIDVQTSNWITPILIFFGFFSVWEIYYGDRGTQNYVVLQVGSILFSLLVMSLRPSGRLPNGPFYIGLVPYVCAKLFEAADKGIYDILGVISGHSLKHVMATIGLASIVKAFKQESAA